MRTSTKSMALIASVVMAGALVAGSAAAKTDVYYDMQKPASTDNVVTNDSATTPTAGLDVYYDM